MSRVGWGVPGAKSLKAEDPQSQGVSNNRSKQLSSRRHFQGLVIRFIQATSETYRKEGVASQV